MSLSTPVLNRKQEYPLVQTGGPQQPQQMEHDLMIYDDMPWGGLNAGSHMPLDSEPHWYWNNPLNLIPVTLLLLLIIALIGVYF